jgi:hypothetical protein
MTPGRVKRLERYEEYGGLYAYGSKGAWPGYRSIGKAGIYVYLGIYSDMPE